MKIRIGMFAAAALALFLVEAWPVNAANAQALLGLWCGKSNLELYEAGQGNGYGYAKECERIRSATSAVAA